MYIKEKGSIYIPGAHLAEMTRIIKEERICQFLFKDHLLIGIHLRFVPANMVGLFDLMNSCYKCTEKDDTKQNPPVDVQIAFI